MKQLYTTLLLLTAMNASAETPLIKPAVVVPAVDKVALFAEDLEQTDKAGPFRYAVTVPVEGISVNGADQTGGQWTLLSNGNWLWQARIQASEASSIDLGFSNYWLPDGAELRVMSSDRSIVHGPFTDEQNQAHREFWSPLVFGDDIVIELTVPEALRNSVQLTLNELNYGYRLFDEVFNSKSLSCNVDVVCSEGDPYRDQIRSVVQITFGGALCSGALINNTNEDNTPYVLTANHCGFSAQNTPGAVFYFNYESDTCRTGAASGTPLPRSIGDPITGATLIANNGDSDFQLLQLNSTPPDSFNPFFAGWDRQDNPPSMAASVHHPAGDEKRLSIENDPLLSPNQPQFIGGVGTLVANGYWVIPEWDVGITEGGSSGSPLFNEQNRIIGQLAGGAAFSCPGAEEGPDFYGKLATSWERGTTPQTRLSDWLDPINSNAQFLNGTELCDAPTVTANTSANPARAGDLVTFTASATGGTGPYTFSWDVDGDGETDVTGPTAEARYPSSGQINVSVTAVDSVACPGTQTIGLAVNGPQIEYLSSGTPVEQCGDGDSIIEPGESWSFPVTLRNNGSETATGAVASFATSGGGSRDNTDAFGNNFTTSAQGSCSFNYIDIQNTGSALSLSDNDDGAGVASLGGPGFSIYGDTFTQLGVATNGYISANTSENGGDFNNDCPLPRTPDAGATSGARIAPLHDDLVQQPGGAIYHQYFADCPRPSETGNTAGCNIIQWENFGFFTSFTTPPDGNFSFQAVLYDDTNQMAFQYPVGNPANGSSSTTGIQNSNATDGLTVACDTNDSIPDNSAICIFNPSASLPDSSEQPLDLRTTSFELGDLAPGASTTVMLNVEIGADFVCGQSFSVDYLGAGSDEGFSLSRQNAIIVQDVGDGSCTNPANACFAPNNNTLLPQQGFWFNQNRPGNGLDLHVGGNGQIYSAWYTALADHTPTWYYIQPLTGQLIANNQIRAELLRFTGPAGAATFEIVGEVIISLVNETTGLMTWTLDGENSGELIEFLSLQPNTEVNLNITDQWFNMDQAGWGIGMHSQGQNEFSAVYFYDTSNQPSWVVTLNPADLANGQSPVGVFTTHCPGCVWIPPQFDQAGTLSRSFDTPNSGQITLDAQSQTPSMLNWQRNNLPVTPLRDLFPE